MDEDKAQILHSRMMDAPANKYFDQEELQNLMNITDPVQLLTLAQQLIDKKLIKLVKVDDSLKFQAVSTSEAKKLTSMSGDEAMIYSHIEASGREGIWTKTIKAKTNLHQHIVLRCLKSLENQRYIKSIKSVKHPTRKIYMLYNLQPSIEVTGGPWFTDSELDVEFIDSLLTVIWRFVAAKTFPSAFQPPSSNTNIVQSSFPSNHTGFVNLDNIMEFITSNKITNVDLAAEDIRSLCEVLIFDDKLELARDTVDIYKATWQSVLEAGYGRTYLEKGELSEKMLETNFSLFDHYAVVEQEVPEDEKSYFDAWGHE